MSGQVKFQGSTSEVNTTNSSESDLEKLEWLALVSKVTTELQNHADIGDKTVAEWIIALHEQSDRSRNGFKGLLDEEGVEFTDSLIDVLDRLICALNPKYKKYDSHNRAAKFPGLQIQNDASWDAQRKKLQEEESAKQKKQESEVDDVLRQMEQLQDKPITWDDDIPSYVIYDIEILK
jgi:ATP-dependent RNA helicase DHX8/PRP22